MSPKPTKDKKYTKLIDVGVYYYEGFDFESYFNFEKINQEQMLLNVIKESITDIAKSIGISIAEISDAHEKVLNRSFPLDNSWVEYMHKRIHKQSRKP